MLHYPAVMSHVQEEIDNVLGSEGIPSMKDKQSMPFTEATILEIQRMSEIVPFSVPHTTLQVNK